jgi:putative multiple sugar transport system substrate-binding protein
MGEYLEAALNLKSGAGPFNIEVFAGDPKDNNAHLFFEGSMKVLKPYIDKGQLVIPSKETSFDQAATKDWDAKNATARMEKLLAANPGTSYAAILSPNDGVAGGIREALSKGYSGSFPLITGTGCRAQGY